MKTLKELIDAQHKWDLTLREINTLVEAGELSYGVEYDDESDFDDLFTLTEIISPYNEQKIMYARVPICLLADLYNERETTENTWEHCDIPSNMLSDLRRELSDIETEEERDDVIRQYNQRLTEEEEKLWWCIGTPRRFFRDNQYDHVYAAI